MILITRVIKNDSNFYLQIFLEEVCMINKDVNNI